MLVVLDLFFHSPGFEIREQSFFMLQSQNIQFAADWSDLSNPSLKANQWGLYIWMGCIFSWSATVLLFHSSRNKVIIN